jgi:hypothetical protein
MTPDDKRAAVGISVGLSGQLMAASLALLGILGAYVSYVLAERESGVFFLVAAAMAAAAFSISAFIAGKAITKDRNAGYAGDWSLTAAKSLYNAQAALLLVGLLAFAAALGSTGRRYDSGGDHQVIAPTERILPVLDSLRSSDYRLSADIAGLRARVDSLASSKSPQQARVPAR